MRLTPGPIVVASHNRGKVREIVDLLGPYGFDVRSAAELGLPEPEDEDEQAPAGDLDILGDLWMSAMDLAVLLDDFDLYPDEMLSDVARQLGFGEQFDDAVGLSPA